LPAHGSASAQPRKAIDECIAHRAKREYQLLAALGSVPRGVSELARELYKGLPAQMMRFAELQVLAGLQKLAAEGHAQKAESENGEVWYAN
jgi:aminoglycoside phosphotransferase (APT) family kinase protein